MTMRTSRSGFASLAAIALSMLIVLVLVMLYMHTFLPTGPKGGPAGGALEAAKTRAHDFEEQQKRHLDDLQRQLAE
jgi:hypothetical protein